MIIVEGPDGGGKTTLVNNLGHGLGLEIVKKAVNHDMTAATDLPEYIDAQLELGFGPRLYDRFALVSGPIYGPMFGMKPPNDIFKNFTNCDRWQRQLAEIKPVVIYCLPKPMTVRHNLTSSLDPTNSSQADVFMKIYWAYAMDYARRVSERTGKIYLYDYETDHPRRVTNWVSMIFSAMEIDLPHRKMTGAI